MKCSVYIICVLLFLTTACQEDEFIYDYPETDKLLVAITSENGGYITEFKYDSLNQIVEIYRFIGGEKISQESFTYNNKRQLIEKKYGSFTDNFKYNPGGRLVEKNTHFTPDDGKYEWDVLTEYKYKTGRISEAVVHKRKYVGIENSEENEVLDNHKYKYDANGNTLEKNAGFDKYKFKYDSKINPLAEYGIVSLYGYSISFTLQPEIKQINNPVYNYTVIGVMSSLPPEYEISYEYNSDKLPVKAEITRLGITNQQPYSWEFIYETKK